MRINAGSVVNRLGGGGALHAAAAFERTACTLRLWMTLQMKLCSLTTVYALTCKQ